MKKYRLILIIILFLTLFFNINGLRCQEEAQMLNSQYRPGYGEKSPENISEDTIDERNVGIRMLEVSLKQHISKRYQKLYTEELEDRLGKRGD